MKQTLERIQELDRQSKGDFSERFRNYPLVWAIAASSFLLFVCSGLKHALFQSTAFDLAVFDQAIYLISQGKPAISSLLGFHILGDHAALILYPLALLYKIYPNVHWLFAVQAIALSSGAAFASHLAAEAGLKGPHRFLIAIAYLLYPLVFNINLFDFHPDVFVPAGLLAAVLAARRDRIGRFVVAIALVLSCKAVLSLTVAAMGVWLFFGERRRLYGAIALFAGIGWFAIATQILIPSFGGEAAHLGRHLWRYAYLGDSFADIFYNLFLRPQRILSKLFSLDSLRYLVLLIFPLLWGLSPRHLAPLISAIPALLLNLLADDPLQRDLIHQYSLPILPFLLLAVISALAVGEGWRISRRTAILWCAIAFFSLAKPYSFVRYLSAIDTRAATRNAIAQIQPQASILTDNRLAPHLAHRPVIKLINMPFSDEKLATFDCILLDLRRPWPDNVRQARTLAAYFQHHPNFQLRYQRDGIYLFVAIDSPHDSRHNKEK